MQALVVDDSSAMRMILGRILKELGFEVTQACDGQDALSRLAEIEDPALVLVDWNMPVMNGFEFIEAVRAQSIYDAVRLMMVTTETEMDQVMKALEAGANEYVMKPFTKDVILDKLQMLGLTEHVG